MTQSAELFEGLTQERSMISNGEQIVHLCRLGSTPEHVQG